MRHLSVIIALSALLMTSAAFAQAASSTSPEKAIAADTPAVPAVAVPAPATAPKELPNATPIKKDEPASNVDISHEPDLKVVKGSGGKSTSSLVTDAPLSDDYVMGKKSAPIVIVEYASMSCPHCAHFSNTVLPELEKNYINTGKVRYILRQFPLNEPALKGAMLLDCVGQQDQKKYFTFAKVLFDAQNKWAFDGNFLAGLETIANVGGLTKEQFAGCVNNTDREMKLLKQKQLTDTEVKVPHTPYIFIDGEAFEGDRTIEAVSQFIDAKLAQKH